MWIDDKAIGAFDARELISDTGRCESCRAVGAIDMEPNRFRAADVSDTGQIINKAEVGCAAGGDNRKDPSPVFWGQFIDRPAQFRPEHSAIAGYGCNVGIHHKSRLRDRRMRAFGGYDEAPGCGGLILAPLAASGDQCAEVARGAAAYKNPAGAGWKAC